MKRKSSEGAVGQPSRKKSQSVGPINVTPEDSVAAAVPEVESTPKKKYVEVTTLEKLQDVEQILLDLRGNDYIIY